MAYRKLPLASLVVNPANDRHGELENETAAIAQLFATHGPGSSTTRSNAGSRPIGTASMTYFSDDTRVFRAESARAPGRTG